MASRPRKASRQGGNEETLGLYMTAEDGFPSLFWASLSRIDREWDDLECWRSDLQIEIRHVEALTNR